MKDFTEVRVLVVGDVMLDRYWWGTVNRMSPEAPVPVVKLERQTLAAGGAANVAANITGLNATPLLVGLIGDDEGGKELLNVLERINLSSEYLIKLSNRPTTVKTRIVAHNQHVVRIDDENTAPLDTYEVNCLKERVLSLLSSADVLLLSDYAKGVISQELLKDVIGAAKARNIPILVDPKGRDYSRYSGATLLTPNRKEALQASGLDVNEPHDIDEIGIELLAKLQTESLLITLGEYGMAFFCRNQSPMHLQAVARDVYDVTGAGDTVIATLSVAVGAGLSLQEAAMLANKAAGIVVEQVGTSAIKLNDLQQAWE